MNQTRRKLLTNRTVTLEQMRAFIFVAEVRSFHHGANNLLRTQSAVTQSIIKLDGSLNCSLIERVKGRFINITAEGERFLKIAKDIVHSVADAAESVRDAQTYHRLSVGIPDDFSIPNLHGVISKCMTSNPRLRIEVTSALSSQIHRLLDEEAVDIAILKRTWPIYESTRRPKTSERLLHSEPLHWVANETLDFESLREVPLVAFPAGCVYREAATGILQACGKALSFSYVSASYDNIRAAVFAGLGIGVLPQSAVGAGLKVLTKEQGFPDLPPVHLAMIWKSQCSEFQEFAGLIEDVFHPRTRPALASTLALF